MDFMSVMPWLIPVVVIVIMIVVFLPMFRQLGGALGSLTGDSKLTQRLMQTGKPANATILNVWQTGLTVNDNPQVGFLLEVQPEGEPSFQAQVKHIVPLVQLGQIAPGAQLAVRYDPVDKTKVALVPET